MTADGFVNLSKRRLFPSNFNNLFGGLFGYFFLGCGSFRYLLGGNFFDNCILSNRSEIDPLDDSHRGGVTHAGAELGDAAIATLAILRSGCRFGEKLLNRFLLAEKSDRQTTGMKIVALGEGDQLFREALRLSLTVLLRCLIGCFRF
jgi:hypothetical protein